MNDQARLLQGWLEQSRDRQLAVQVYKAHGDALWDLILKDGSDNDTVQNMAANIVGNVLYHQSLEKQPSLPNSDDGNVKASLERVSKLASSCRTGALARLLFFATLSSIIENGPEKDAQMMNAIIQVLAERSLLESDQGAVRERHLMNALTNLAAGEEKQAYLPKEASERLLSLQLTDPSNELLRMSLLHPSTLKESPAADRIIDALKQKQVDTFPWAVRILQHSNGCRRQIRCAIFPSKKTQENEELMSRMVELLKSPHADQVLNTGRMLLMIVSNEPARLVYQLGFGPLAGFLYMAGMLDNDQLRLRQSADAIHRKPLEDLSSDEEALLNASDFDVIAGQGIAQKPQPAMSMTEKEQEAERLMGLLQRLQRTGVVEILPSSRSASDDDHPSTSK